MKEELINIGFIIATLCYVAALMDCDQFKNLEGR